jgi:hypothetical protein
MREILLTRAESVGSAGKFGGVEVILAEAAVNYLAESSFDNLLELEVYIAAAVHAVILIVESPGSICELGAFVMIPEIRKKLIVVMQSEYIDRSSFITKGAIQHFKDNDSGAQILGYNWTIDQNTRSITVAQFVIEDMLGHLPEAMDAVHTTHAKELFKQNDEGHLLFLALTFCHMLRAAKLIDIRRCFAFIEISITEKKLKHYLDILIICGFIKPFTHGKLKFFVAIVDQMPLEIAFKEGTGMADRNTVRWLTRIVDKIRDDKDEKIRIDIFRGARNA